MSLSLRPGRPVLRLPLVLALSALALSALALASCSTVSTPDDRASSAPRPVAGYDWHLNEDDTEASLAYGLAETDDVPMDLACHLGSGQLSILHNVDKHSASKIVLESGGDTETYAAQAESSPLGDSLDLTATTSSRDPVFLRFRSLGWLAVHLPSGRQTYVASEGSRPQIARFFKLCDSGS